MCEADPIPTLTYIVEKIKACHPDLSYVHLVEPRVQGGEDLVDGVLQGEQNDFIREISSPVPLITAGGYNRQLALDVAEEKGDIIALGRHYMSNVSLVHGIPAAPALIPIVLQPDDLPLRLQKNNPPYPYDRQTFGLAMNATGYIDQPFADQKANALS
jgi:NADPH2 dehydrogenase